MWKAWYPEVFPGTTQVKIFEHGSIQRREGCRSLKQICENKSDSMHFRAGLVVGKVGVEPPIPAVSASPDIGMVGVEPSNSPAWL